MSWNFTSCEISTWQTVKYYLKTLSPGSSFGIGKKNPVFEIDHFPLFLKICLYFEFLNRIQKSEVEEK